MVDANAGIVLNSKDFDFPQLSLRDLHRWGGPTTRKLGLQELRVVERIEVKRGGKRHYSEVVDMIKVNELPTQRYGRQTNVVALQPRQ